MKTIPQRQPGVFGHETIEKERFGESIVVSGKAEGRRARERQILTACVGLHAGMIK